MDATARRRAISAFASASPLYSISKSTRAAIAEIVGCYLPYLWLRQGRTPWLLAPAAVSLAFFAWLLSLHPAAAGRVYAAYGGVYVVTAIFWLWAVDGVTPDRWDLLGGVVTLTGMTIIMFSPR